MKNITTEPNIALEMRCRCFQCRDGCIHLVVGNTMLALHASQFLRMVEAVNQMYRQLQKERDFDKTAAPRSLESVVM